MPDLRSQNITEKKIVIYEKQEGHTTLLVQCYKEKRCVCFMNSAIKYVVGTYVIL